ncbi:MAG: mercuric reductase, partial [Candidatus Atribacteria bacterium]|nr:mercuric reductase [Candidatus Atribacteria bacterium]
MSHKPRNFDAIIIGSGQGGNPLAIALAQKGWQVALVEREHIGGSCINTACTPTKTMIASARIVHLIHRAQDFGIDSATGSVNLSKVLRRKNDIVTSFRNGSREQLTSTSGITLIEGNARFVGKKLLEIDLLKGEKEKIQSEYIFINTGTKSSKPPIPGIDDVNALDSTSMMEIDKIPEHLLIIGGGYVGLEFGQMFRRFGSQVTIIQLNDQLLPLEDEDIAEEIAEILQQEGIQILLRTNTVKIDAPEKEKIVLSVKIDEKEQTLEGSHLLVATGRVPNTSTLNPEETGISLDNRGFIPVNARLETTVPGIFAIGDVKGGPAFTHIAYDDHKILLKNILEGGQATISDRILPYVVFIDPQLGRIGLNEKQAKSQGYDYRVAKIPMSWVARAIETDETKGTMKAMIDRKT